MPDRPGDPKMFLQGQRGRTWTIHCCSTSKTIGRLIKNCWLHYFDIYHRHFARYRGRACTIVEFGVFHGGSLQMWREYFGPARASSAWTSIRGCANSASQASKIIIGDQNDPRLSARKLARRVGPIDILIDDGGHAMSHQINTLEELYGAVRPDGVILVEDTHTSYWRGSTAAACAHP